MKKEDIEEYEGIEPIQSVVFKYIEPTFISNDWVIEPIQSVVFKLQQWNFWCWCEWY